MKNLFLSVFSAIIVLSILLFSNANSQQVQQQNQLNSTSIAAVAEDFKDCFLDFKSKNIFGVGQDVVYLIGLACYETYKSEGKFPHQITQTEKLIIENTLLELTASSDLDKILEAFGP